MAEDLFEKKGMRYVQDIIRLAIEEDERDLTAEGIFSESDMAEAVLISREDTYVVGLPLIPIIFEEYFALYSETTVRQEKPLFTFVVEEGSFVVNNTTVATFYAPTRILLKLERIFLNFITHLSGVANHTKIYLDALHGTNVQLLDTRKTLPGHRYLEKYAVRIAGAQNHRMNLSEMLMVKNNHVDAAGSITLAVEKLRETYKEKCPPIVVECRDKAEVIEAVRTRPLRILLDNMSKSLLDEILPLIPKDIEAEISGGVNLNNIKELALSASSNTLTKNRLANFISVGNLTHSAPIADFSMRIKPVKIINDELKC